MDKKTSRKVKKSKKSKRSIRSVKSIKDKSVKQNVNIHVSSGGGSGGSGALPNPFLAASNDRRGEDVLLQKLTDLLSVNKKIAEPSKPAMIDSSTSSFNDIGTNTDIQTNNFTPSFSEIPSTDEIETDTFNEMINASTQIDNKFNNLFEPSENIKVETKPNIDNQSLLDNVLTIQNTPARNSSIVEGQGFTMYKPTENKTSYKLNLDPSVKVPTRDEMRSLRNLINLKSNFPNNEGAIIPFSDVKSEAKVPTKEETKDEGKEEPKEKSTKFKSIVKVIPSKWIEKYNLKPEITKQ